MSPPRTACASPAEKDILCVPTTQPQNQPQPMWPPSAWPVLGDGHVSGHASAWNFSGLTDLGVLGESSYSAEHGHLGLSVLGRPRWDTAGVVGARCLPGLPWEVTPSAIGVSVGSALGSGTSISHQTQVLEPWCPQPAPQGSCAVATAQHTLPSPGASPASDAGAVLEDGRCCAPSCWCHTTRVDSRDSAAAAHHWRDPHRVNSSPSGRLRFPWSTGEVGSSIKEAPVSPPLRYATSMRWGRLSGRGKDCQLYGHSLSPPLPHSPPSCTALC